ncbi:MAG TPA: hypothetical protein ENH10_03105 [Bacteroidetes bacterium]|nr:hypothetical protein [Bacteroidota bacterium]HEX04130.1 hypothetical protein [Bacteroidota bacterium]
MSGARSEYTPTNAMICSVRRRLSANGYPDNSAMIYAPVTRRLFGGSQGFSTSWTLDDGQ